MKPPIFKGTRDHIASKGCSSYYGIYPLGVMAKDINISYDWTFKSSCATIYKFQLQNLARANQ
ncbi:hypothetical protein TSUD_366260 [Trifolium subterraneum]|uniref:Uncharacterized protein n=1 Tax=Trifolium subterraneum TaxID=3900 RepID=A0A2Z6PFZ6_TRISU|nr:hypothetical protein TSUD_366260 [Trifolium subterraneum]